MFTQIKRLVSAYRNAQAAPDYLDFLDSLYQNDDYDHTANTKGKK